MESREQAQDKREQEWMAKETERKEMLAKIDEQIGKKKDMIDQMLKKESAEEYVDDLLGRSGSRQ